MWQRGQVLHYCGQIFLQIPARFHSVSDSRGIEKKATTYQQRHIFAIWSAKWSEQRRPKRSPRVSAQNRVCALTPELGVSVLASGSRHFVRVRRGGRAGSLFACRRIYRTSILYAHRLHSCLGKVFLNFPHDRTDISISRQQKRKTIEKRCAIAQLRLCVHRGYGIWRVQLSA